MVDYNIANLLQDRTLAITPYIRAAVLCSDKPCIGDQHKRPCQLPSRFWHRAGGGHLTRGSNAAAEDTSLRASTSDVPAIEKGTIGHLQRVKDLLSNRADRNLQHSRAAKASDGLAGSDQQASRSGVQKEDCNILDSRSALRGSTLKRCRPPFIMSDCNAGLKDASK